MFPQADMMLEMQQRMMDYWSNMMQMATGQAAQNGMTSLMGQQMATSQAMAVRVIDMAMNTWQQMADSVNNGESWEEALQKQMTNVREQVTEAMTEGIQLSENTTELWQSYMEQWQLFSTPWMQAWSQSLDIAPKVAQGDTKAFIESSNLYFQAYQDTLGKILEAPGLGLNRELDEKVRKSFAAWIDMQQTSYEYQIIMADAWVKSFERLMQELITMTENGQEIGSVREFLNRWSETADEMFKDIFRSDDFVVAQGKYVNSMMALRLRQREVSETILQYSDMPTRSEINEAHRRIYMLNKEMKQLRKELAALRDDKPKSAAKKKTTTRSRKKTKSKDK